MSDIVPVTFGVTPTELPVSGRWFMSVEPDECVIGPINAPLCGKPLSYVIKAPAWHLSDGNSGPPNPIVPRNKTKRSSKFHDIMRQTMPGRSMLVDAIYFEMVRTELKEHGIDKRSEFIASVTFMALRIAVRVLKWKQTIPNEIVSRAKALRCEVEQLKPEDVTFCYSSNTVCTWDECEACHE